MQHNPQALEESDDAYGAVRVQQRSESVEHDRDGPSTPQAHRRKAARIPPSRGRAATGLDCGRGSSYRHCNETQFIHGAPVQKQRVAASSIIIIVVSTRSIVDIVSFGVTPPLLPAERVGGEVHARSIASESPHPSIPPLHRRPRMGSIPAPLEAHATIISIVIAFVVIIVIVVIGIAIIATIAVVASIKQLVDIQHAADRRDEDDRPVATPAELLERFPDEEGTGYAVSDIVVIVSPTAATAATAARRRRRVAAGGSAIRRVLQQDRVPPRRRRVGEGGGAGRRRRRQRRRRRVAVAKWERTHDGWRGAETWGFHESPSYPHKYCFWPGEKELNLNIKHTTLEPNYNQLFLNLG